MLENIGEISQKEELVIEWSIKDFPSLTEWRYDSPRFSFGNESWYLGIYPNIPGRNKTQYFTEVYLFRAPFAPPITVEFTLEVKTVEGKFYSEMHLKHTFNEPFFGRGVPGWITRSELLRRKSDLLPSGTLTLVCRMKRPESAEISSLGSTVTTNCSYCNITLDAQEDIQCHLRRCENFPLNCPKCSDDVALKNWFNHKCQMAEEDEDGVLCQDFKKMLLNGKNYDLILKVGDRELRAHRDVLSARSPVFESMLNYDMTEKENGVVDIPDCDPQAMELFLSYVYSAKTDGLDRNNMLGLYYIADKYEMRGLKEECREFIKKSLSHTNVCEVIKLALTHSDTSLLDYATEYFMDNADNIMVTVEWQSFLKDNATVGNELMLKTFRKMKDSKN